MNSLTIWEIWLFAFLKKENDENINTTHVWAINVKLQPAALASS